MGSKPYKFYRISNLRNFCAFELKRPLEFTKDVTRNLVHATPLGEPHPSGKVIGSPCNRAKQRAWWLKMWWEPTTLFLIAPAWGYLPPLGGIYIEHIHAKARAFDAKTLGGPLRASWGGR